MEEMILGKNEEKREDSVVFKDKNRLYNTLIVGVAGSGKHPLVTRKMVEHDIQNKKKAFIYIDNCNNEDESFLVYAMAKKNRRKVTYFSPFSKKSRINLFIGDISSIKERFKRIINNYFTDSPMYFLHLYESVLNNSLYILKETNNLSMTNLFRILDDRSYALNLIRTVSIGEHNTSKKNAYDLMLNEKTQEHLIGLRLFLNNLINHSELGHLFYEETDKTQTLDISEMTEKEVFIIRMELYKTSQDNKKFLSSIIFEMFDYTFDRNMNTNLYINELIGLQNYLPTIRNMSVLRNISITLIVQSLLFLEEEESFFNYHNLILLPGINLKDKLLLMNRISNERLDKLTYLNFGKFMVDFFNRDTPSYRENKIVCGDFISKEDADFYEKRIKRYKKELLK